MAEEPEKNRTARPGGQARGEGKGGRPPRRRSKQQGQRQAPPPSAGPGNAALWLALAALMLVAGSLVGGYFIWQEVKRQAGWQQEVLAQIDSRNQAMESRIRNLRDRLDDDLAAAARAREAVEATQRRQADAIQGLENAIGLLRAQIGRSHEGWLLAEVQFLLNVANQRVQLARDPDTAIAALRSADRRLQELADPTYTPVREEIAREIAALKAVPRPDLEGLALELESLSGQVGGLRLAGTQYVAGEAPSEAAGDDGAPAAEGWRELPSVLWRELKQLVVVRRNDQPVAPMLAPDQQYFLYENLRLQFDTARLALLRQEPGAYRAALDRAAEWLRTQFDQEAPATRAMLEAVTRLEAVDIRPELPEIAGSLRRLRQEMRLAGMEEAEAGPEAGAPSEPGSEPPAAEAPGSSESADEAGDTPAAEAPAEPAP